MSSKKPVKLDDYLFKQIKNNVSETLGKSIDRVKKETLEIDDIIKIEKISKIELRSIRNYYVIRTVTFLEKCLKTLFIEFIDKHELNYEGKIILRLKDLKLLRKNSDFTNGEIIANRINFQNFRNEEENLSIMRIFSDMFQVDNLLKKMKDTNNKTEGYYRKILELIDERNKVVHDFQDTKFSMSECINSFSAMIGFLTIFLDTINEYRLENRLRKKN